MQHATARATVNATVRATLGGSAAGGKYAHVFINPFAAGRRGKRLVAMKSLERIWLAILGLAGLGFGRRKRTA